MIPLEKVAGLIDRHGLRRVDKKRLITVEYECMRTNSNREGEQERSSLSLLDLDTI